MAGLRVANVRAAGGYHGGDIDVEVAESVAGDAAVGAGRGDVEGCLEGGVEGATELLLPIVVVCERRALLVGAAGFGVLEGLLTGLDVAAQAVPLVSAFERVHVAAAVDGLEVCGGGGADVDLADGAQGVDGFVVAEVAREDVVGVVFEVLDVFGHLFLGFAPGELCVFELVTVLRRGISTRYGMVLLEKKKKKDSLPRLLAS